MRLNGLHGMPLIPALPVSGSARPGPARPGPPGARPTGRPVRVDFYWQLTVL